MPSPFSLEVPRNDGSIENVTVSSGDTLFVLGPNGVGKSSLLHKFYVAHRNNAHRIAAHRQTWFTSNAIEMTAAARRSTETNMLNSDAHLESRWRDNYSTQRSGIALYDLMDAENVRARAIADAVTANEMDVARELAKREAPLTIINDLLRQSNLPIEISVRQYEEIFARKKGGEPYSVAQLSDGERNALLIAAAVLTVKPDTLLIIDEPERHLHRSIISPLLTQLFKQRPDCAFVVSTHDVMLPVDNPASRTLLVRDCVYRGQTPHAWDADVLPVNTDVSDDLKEDILGSRRRILFVEGTESSLDKPLYSLVFPNISIVPKSSCRNVERAVSGIRDSQNIHWVKAWGVVDNDMRIPADIAKLKSSGVHVLSVYSVESLYYHPEIQSRVAVRQANVTGADAATNVEAAKAAALSALAQHGERLCSKVALNRVREAVFSNLPTQDDLRAGNAIKIDVDVSTILATEKEHFARMLESSDLMGLISHYPIRETPLPSEVARRLGFPGRDQYEAAVRKLLVDDGSALEFVRSLFQELWAELSSDGG